MLSTSNGNHRHLPKPIVGAEAEAEPTTPQVLYILSLVLEKLVARNERLYCGLSDSSRRLRNNRILNVFDGARPPNITVPKYLERIYKFTNCSPSCFVVGYVYIDRLVHKHPDSLVVSINVHRLIITSVMLASKMLDDMHYNNAFYARVGGVSNTELNKLELELLFLLDFEVTVSFRVFECYCQQLEKEMLGCVHNIQRPVIVSSIDDVTEISIEDTQTSSPPLLPPN